MVVFHKHHIIPKHAGGTDEPHNIIKVNVALHAFLHKILYEEHGCWQDKIAWQMLSGQITVSQAIKETQRNYMKTRVISDETRRRMGDSNRRRSLRGEHPLQGKKFSIESRMKMSISHLGQIPANKGHIKSDEEKEKDRQAQYKVPKYECGFCGKLCRGKGNLNQHIAKRDFNIKSRNTKKVRGSSLFQGRAPFALHKGVDQMSKKKNRQSNRNQQNNQAAFQLRPITPLTDNQQKTFDLYKKDRNMVLHGYAGTGKSYISLYLALNEILTQDSIYNRLIIMRSVVPSRDMGFLPGSMKEKIRVYEEPYQQICNNLFGRSEYDALKLRGTIDFTTTSYLRGLTFDNSIIVCDEMQNMNFAELDTVMTRVGDRSKIIFCGDFRQTDLMGVERDGLKQFLNIVKQMDAFDFVEFESGDIIRSKMVKDYIIIRTKWDCYESFQVYGNSDRAI